MLRLALRNILRQPGRAGLTLAAIALGVASLVMSGGFVADILRQLRDATIHSQLGHLQIYKAGQFESGGNRPLEFLIDDPAAVQRAVASVPGVVVQGQRLAFSGLLGNGHGELPVLGEGVEADAESRIGQAFSMLTGRQLASGDTSGAVIGEGVAAAMKLKVGDRINLVVSTREGATNALDFDVVGVFRSLSKEYDARAVRIPLKAAQELTDTRGVTAIVVLLNDTDATDAARAAIEHALPPGFEVKTWLDLAEFYTSTAALYERQFGFLQVIILVMVLLSVANAVNMTLHERIPEFGIMRALGRTGRDVFALAVVETSALGAVGALVGVVIGVLLAVIISAVGIPMAPPPNSESGFTAGIRVVPWILGAAFASGLVATVAAALLPARHLARIPVVEALRRGV
ncbi:MAG TPA: ABC transporter permease [Casimicrobiaceae bacterium]|nr:ABC transporter permease [Casimicrobiaceae bacterium]